MRLCLDLRVGLEEVLGFLVPWQTIVLVLLVRLCLLILVILLSNQKANILGGVGHSRFPLILKNWSRDFAYQCHNKVKYPSLLVKKSVDYIAVESQTYINMTGPTSKIKKSFSKMWDSTSGPSSKAGKLFD